MKNPILFLLLALTYVVSSCSTEAAEKTVTEFHDALDAGEHALICDELLDDEALAANTREEWMDVLRGLTSYGEITKRKKQSGFSKKTSNGVTTTRLKYTFVMDGTTYYERFVLVDRGDGPGKILAYSFNVSESKADDFVAEY